MPTTVGLQRTESGVIEAAAQLEMDCVAAYHQAAAHLRDRRAAAHFDTFERASEAHRDLWQARLAALGHAPAAPNQLTAWLNAWKVRVAAAVSGDWGIYRALGNNAPDQCAAYGRVHDRHLSAITDGLAVGMLADAKLQWALIQALQGNQNTPS